MKPYRHDPECWKARNRPEVALLLACANMHGDARAGQHVQALVDLGSLDWAWITRQAIAHGMMPRLYRHLRDVSSDNLPASVRQDCETSTRRNAQRSLFLSGALLKLLALFQAHKLHVLPFKGPLFALSTSGNLSLRQFGDLDILVDQDDYQHAQDILRSEGFQLARTFSHESTLVDPRGRVCVDLHYAVTPDEFPVTLNFNSLWKRRRPVSLCGKIASTLSSEDMFLVLSIQIAKDAWDHKTRLSKICDLTELLRSHPTMDWAWINAEASRLGCLRILFVTLHLIHDVLGMLLPDDVRDQFRPRSSIHFLSQHIRDQLFDEPANTFAQRLRTIRFSFAVRERVRDTPPLVILRILLRNIFIPQNNDRALVPLPKPLSFLYYLVRPVRLLVKHTTRLRLWDNPGRPLLRDHSR